MKWIDYEKQNLNVDIDGQRMYICDARIASGGNKFVRNLKPTEVVIYSVANRPSSKRRYYHKYYFLEVKKGKTTSKEISPFDNTAMSVSVNIFDNYEDCVKCYNKQLEDAVEEYKQKILELEADIERTNKMKLAED